MKTSPANVFPKSHSRVRRAGRITAHGVARRLVEGRTQVLFHEIEERSGVENVDGAGRFFLVCGARGRTREWHDETTPMNDVMRSRSMTL